MTRGQDARAQPLCSVITPTWHRHELLLNRCIPSVQAQDCPRVEHVIVSDGQDDELAFQLGLMIGQRRWKDAITYRELPWHPADEHWGHYARLAGLLHATGTYITYCDDDDALRPEHCRLMAAALDADPEAGFAVSRMVSHGGAHPTVSGWGPLACGNVGTPMIMHRRSILAHGTWGPASFTEDWDLVQRWLEAGVRYVNVDAETSDVWPSAYRGPS
jgi:glycosyltransferase involved in cell wall biosynthesis